MRLAPSLRVNKSLQELNLFETNLLSQGACYLAEALKFNRTLKEIYLGENRIGDDAAATAIQELLRVNRSLLKMNLMDNPIGAKGSSCLAAALVTNLRLQVLDLGLETRVVAATLLRNAQVAKMAQTASLFLVGIRNGVTVEGMGSLGKLPKNIVLMMAKKVWDSRGDCEWLR